MNIDIFLKKIKDFLDGSEEADGFQRRKVLKYGYITMVFDFPQMREIQSRIFPTILYDGKEDDEGCLSTNTYIQLPYGIRESVSMSEIVDWFKLGCQASCMAHNMSIHQLEDYDILKFEVKGEIIDELKGRMWGLTRTTLLPAYTDYLRVADIKSGSGKMLVNLYNQEEYKLELKYAIYCDVYGDKYLVKNW